MNKQFIKTKNVKNLILLMDSLLNAPSNVPKMALVYGEPGLGKSDAIMWWATQNDAVYVRAMKGMSSRWLLEEIVRELDESPCYMQAQLIEQINEIFKTNSKMIIVDEVDYLLNNTNSVDVLRDLHDRFKIPVVMVGMEMSQIKLKHNKPLYSRLYQTLKFQHFNLSDVEDILSNLTELKFTQEAIEYIFNNAKEFRQLVKIVDKIEKISKINEINNFDVTIIKEFVFNAKQNLKAS